MKEYVYYSLISVSLFSLASIVFTTYSKRFSVAWMNYFKASVASIGFLGIALYTDHFRLPSLYSIWVLGASGVIGLCIGDMLLLKSYTTLGPGRTLIVFSFHPIFTGIGSFILFGQGLLLSQAIAILFMLICLLLLGSENIDENKKWQFGPLLIALGAISLDALGVLLTRMAFERDPAMDSSMANLIRSFFCVIAFSIWTAKSKIGLIGHFRRLKASTQAFIFIASFFGTCVSLFVYLKALKIGHLATISAIVATGPLWAAIFEFIFFGQKPTKKLYYTFVAFACGMYFLNAGF